jgi:transposase
MARPLSLDLRIRVAAALAEGSTVREAAKRFGVSVASAVRMGNSREPGMAWLLARSAATARRSFSAWPTRLAIALRPNRIGRCAPLPPTPAAVAA